MSKFDRADPGLDPDYCDGLTPDPFDEDRADLAFGFPDVPDVSRMTAETAGLTVLLFILSSDVDVYGLLSLESLQLAEHAARIAVSAHDVTPIAVDRISAVRMRLIRSIATLSKPVDTAIVSGPQPVKPSDGSRPVRPIAVPVQPITPSSAIRF